MESCIGMIAKLQMIQIATYITDTTQIMGITLAQIPDPQEELTYSEVKNGLQLFYQPPISSILRNQSERFGQPKEGWPFYRPKLMSITISGPISVNCLRKC
jgi:hypothetical protein